MLRQKCRVLGSQKWMKLKSGRCRLFGSIIYGFWTYEYLDCHAFFFFYFYFSLPHRQGWKKHREGRGLLAWRKGCEVPWTGTRPRTLCNNPLATCHECQNACVISSPFLSIFPLRVGEWKLFLRKSIFPLTYHRSAILRLEKSPTECSSSRWNKLPFIGRSPGSRGPLTWLLI